MRSMGDLPKPVLILEVLGILLLALAMLLISQWLPLPGWLSGKATTTLMFFVGLALILPAATMLMWRTAQALVLQLPGTSQRDKKKPKTGDSHDADH